MRTKSIVLSCVLTIISLTNTFAQSGRDAPKSTLTPPSQVELSKQTNKETKFVREPDADKYKLIFPVRFEGEFKYVRDKTDWSFPSSQANFLEELNKGGAQGYKFVSSTGDYPFALVAVDEGQYEYQWFETFSSNLYTKTNFGEKHEKLTQQGFRFVDQYLINGLCFTPSDSFLEECRYHDFFLYEKEIGNKPLPYLTIGSVGGWRKSPALEMSTKINEKMADGFLPVAAFSQFEIMLEQTADRDALAADKPDVQVVRSLLTRGILQSKVNELAQQGYRIAIANSGIVIMYKHKADTMPAAYVWLQAKKKDFEKELAKLQQQSAVYRTTYPTDEGEEKTLLFEVPQKAEGKRREYKVLKFDFDVTQNAADGKLHRTLTPESQETLKTLNKLAREGFVARDLFYSDKVNVLLERETN